ncbi:MAG TPA: hypothetical protein VLK82_20840 [Candidatus Tectomicrobia bacterium]|nr:hypothetical protein [Candidatus Tectomicrobia bacterium]
MRQTRHEITQNRGERLCWEIARRDEGRGNIQSDEERIFAENGYRVVVAPRVLTARFIGRRVA